MVFAFVLVVYVFVLLVLFWLLFTLLFGLLIRLCCVALVVWAFVRLFGCL